jgi:hypothetical protein
MRHRARPERGDRAVGVLNAPAGHFRPWAGPRWWTAAPNIVVVDRMPAHRPEILFHFQKFRKRLNKLPENNINLQNHRK